MAKTARKGVSKSVSTANRFDKIIKENLERAAPGLIRRLLRLDFETLEQIKPDLHVTRERRADFVAKLWRKDGPERVVHAEFQLRDEQNLLYRMLDYASVLVRLFPGLEVRQVVFFIGPKPPTWPTWFKMPDHFYRFEGIWLGGIPVEKFLRADTVEEMLLGILADFGQKTPEKVLEAMVVRAKKRSATPLDFLRFTRQLRVLSSIRNFTPIIETIMEKFSEFIVREEDFLFIEGKEAGVELGIEKGIDLKNRQFVRALLERGDYSFEQIASISNVSLDFVRQMAGEMKLDRTV